MSLAGGISGGGPPGSLANCYKNAIVVDSFDQEKSYVFKNDWVSTKDTELTGAMPPRAYDSFKNIIMNSSDYSLRNFGSDSDAVAYQVREVRYYSNPDEIELVLDNDQIVRLSPIYDKLSPFGFSSPCNGFFDVNYLENAVN